jgi:NADH-quinone oxidoreductase subunit C
MTVVERSVWREVLADLHARGYRYLDVLTAIDRIDHVEVIAHVVDPGSLERELRSTLVSDDDLRLASVAAVFPAATWHERETAEMFGVSFDGHPDPRPLLLRTEPALPPLRKASALTARVEKPWPGAPDLATGGRARRPQLPPGVRAAWLPEATT